MRRKSRIGLGLLLIVACGAMLLYIYGWATLSGGEFQDGTAEWWRAVLGTMFRMNDSGPVAIAACLGIVLGTWFILHALWLIFRDLVDPIDLDLEPEQRS